MTQSVFHCVMNFELPTPVRTSETRRQFLFHGLSFAAGDPKVNGVLHDRYQWGKMACAVFEGQHPLQRPPHMPLGE